MYTNARNRRMSTPSPPPRKASLSAEDAVIAVQYKVSPCLYTGMLIYFPTMKPNVAPDVELGSNCGCQKHMASGENQLRHTNSHKLSLTKECRYKQKKKPFVIWAQNGPLIAKTLSQINWYIINILQIICTRKVRAQEETIFIRLRYTNTMPLMLLVQSNHKYVKIRLHQVSHFVCVLCVLCMHMCVCMVIMCVQYIILVYLVLFLNQYWKQVTLCAWRPA